MLLFRHLAHEGASPETIPEAERRRGRAGEQAFALIGPGPGNRERLGRRPRAGLVTPHSGGPGTRPGGITTPLRGASLDWDRSTCFGRAKARQADEANWRRSLEKKPGRKPGNADPGTEIAANGAPRGAFPSRKREGHASQACRAATPVAQGVSQTPAFLGAPLPLTGERRTTACPGPVKNTGDDACLLHPPLEGAKGASAP